jgi:hypothetical protein
LPHHGSNRSTSGLDADVIAGLLVLPIDVVKFSALDPLRELA